MTFDALIREIEASIVSKDGKRGIHFKRSGEWQKKTESKQ